MTQKLLLTILLFGLVLGVCEAAETDAFQAAKDRSSLGRRDAVSVEQTTTAGSSQWIAPYHPLYQWSDVSAVEVPWELITHLVLGYVVPAEISANEYTVEPPSWFGTQRWSDGAQEYIDAGHLAGRTVTCMLGGAGSNPGGIWNRATSPENVPTFAANIVAELQLLGFDGMDLDWEDGVDYQGLVRLAQELRATWPDAVITIPTGFTGEDAAPLAAAADAVDAFMPMSYIAIPQWGGWTLPSPLTPLYVIGANKNSVEWVLQAWIAAGVPSSKIVMGVGGFGLVWGDTNGDGRAPIAPYTNGGGGLAAGESDGIASDNSVSQSWLSETLAEHPGAFVEAWDAAHEISYWHTATEFEQVTVDELYCGSWRGCAATEDVSLVFYETPKSIRTKLLYIDQNNMKGMMFWTLSQMRNGSAYPILEAASATTPRRTLGLKTPRRASRWNGVIQAYGADSMRR
ncbi:MAG: glycoside hydrolase family 18 protein [bacterium]|nr:glycoside hydrolase family 18 protein [bacterium]